MQQSVAFVFVFGGVCSVDLLASRLGGDEQLQNITSVFEKTNICFFVFNPVDKTVEYSDKACELYGVEKFWNNAPQSMLELVHPADRANVESLFREVSLGNTPESITIRGVTLNYCFKVTLSPASYDDSGACVLAVGVVEDETEAFRSEKLMHRIQSIIDATSVDLGESANILPRIAVTLGSLYDAIYYIWMETHSYVCFQEQLSEIVPVIGDRGDYLQAWDLYINQFIVSEDRAAVRDFVEFSTLAQRLSPSGSISIEYRRINEGWTRGQFLVAQRDDFGNPIRVIYTVSDINAERERKVRERRAQFEATHDALSESLNRKAFDEALEQHVFEGTPTGFILLDIDHFKSINDQFGHKEGDHIISRVAKELVQTFRADDMVFRLGGDEFGVLLRNCDQTCWNALCRKLKRIHTQLAENLTNADITLSAGVCFGDNGLEEWMFAVSDEGLYGTKKRGRAGCTLISRTGNVQAVWRDEDASIKARAALSSSNTGVCRMEFSLDNSRPPRMICGDILRKMYRIPEEATPEECFVMWQQGIDPSYNEVLSRAKNQMLVVGNVECTFLWQGIGGEPFKVRIAGSGVIENDKQVLFGLHHSLKDATVVEKEDANLLAEAAQTVVESHILSIAIVNKITGQGSMWQSKTGFSVRESFDLDHGSTHNPVRLSEAQTTELAQKLSIDAITAGLAQADRYVVPFEFGSDGDHRFVEYHVAEYVKDSSQWIIVSEDVTAIHTEEGKSIQDLYNNVPGGLVTYEWDGERLVVLHISKYYEDLYGDSIANDRSGKRVPDFERVHPDDRAPYLKAIQDALATTHELHHVYRVWNTQANGYIWAKTDAISRDLPNGHALVYAMYSDVTDQIEAEQRLIKTSESLTAALSASSQLSYEYDPATQVAVCFSEDNDFGLPRVISDCPETLKQYSVFHPDDQELFYDTVSIIKNGAKHAHCALRLRVKGKYRWYNIRFDKRFDKHIGRDAIVVLVIDITLRVSAMRDYEHRVQSLLYSSEGSMCVGSFNLTKDKIIEFRIQDDDFEYLKSVRSFTDVVTMSSVGTFEGSMRDAYVETFKVDRLIERAKQGETQVRLEGMYKISPTRTEWVQVAVDLIQNPITGDIECIGYVKSVNTFYMSSMLIRCGLNVDYPMAAVLLDEGNEYYLFNSERAAFCEHHVDFWGSKISYLVDIADDIEIKRLHKAIDKDAVLAALARGEEPSFTFDGYSKGRKQRYELRFTTPENKEKFILISLRNITDSALAERLSYEARHDKLTGLYNRRTVFAKCRALLDQHPEDEFTMLSLNIRRFRLFNSFFSEEAGDMLLCAVADGIRAIDADYDYWAYGRLEADVFCAFFPKREGLFDRHVAFIEQAFKSYSSNFLLEPSIGIYEVSDRTLPIESMFTRATTAAKEGGTSLGSVVCCYNETMERELNDELAIASEMHHALETEQFVVYLQPKYDLQTAAHAGAEALVRWVHPKWGLVSPGKFIPVFERNGFIALLDRYMWEHVCKLLRKWLDSGVVPLPVSVNVSRVSAYNPSTVSFLKELVTRYDIPPALLELELTESVYIDDPEEMKCALRDLQNFGFKILMDDFGSGYSSLNTLRELPVDCLKLDMKFLSESCEDERGRMVLSSIVGMTKRLHLPVVAEGVENEVQADYLKSLGCEYVQGFLFARPMPVEEYEEEHCEFPEN